MQIKWNESKKKSVNAIVLLLYAPTSIRHDTQRYSRTFNSFLGIESSKRLCDEKACGGCQCVCSCCVLFFLIQCGQPIDLIFKWILCEKYFKWFRFHYLNRDRMPFWFDQISQARISEEVTHAQAISCTIQNPSKLNDIIHWIFKHLNVWTPYIGVSNSTVISKSPHRMHKENDAIESKIMKWENTHRHKQTYAIYAFFKAIHTNALWEI